MVVEHFKSGQMAAAYERFRKRGRLLPDGLIYIDSWTDQKSGICFQLMKTVNPDLFHIWQELWSDLVDFQIHTIDGPPPAPQP